MSEGGGGGSTWRWRLPEVSAPGQFNGQMRCVCWGESQINSYTVQTSSDQRCLMSVTIAICGMDLFLLLGEICWRGAKTHLSYFNLRDMAEKNELEL